MGVFSKRDRDQGDLVNKHDRASSIAEGCPSFKNINENKLK